MALNSNDFEGGKIFFRDTIYVELLDISILI